MTWTEANHARLATLFDGVRAIDCAGQFYGPSQPYAGYKPEVAEVPNGDTKAQTCAACNGSGNRHRITLCSKCGGTGVVHVPNADAGLAGKRYLHVAPKYNPPQWAADYYDRAFAEACRVATALGVPAAYRPHEAYCALRVLEYPSAACLPNVEIDGNGDDWCQLCGKVDSVISDARVCPALALGAGTAEHTDPDLFTLNLWRSTPDDIEARVSRNMRLDWHAGGEPHHIGELGEIIGLGPPALHRVPARPYVQKAIVFFAIPDHAAELPGAGRPIRGGQMCRQQTVGEWLEKAIEKRRVRK